MRGEGGEKREMRAERCGPDLGVGEPARKGTDEGLVLVRRRAEQLLRGKVHDETEAGRLRQAEQALRLAERYERMQASAAPAPVETDGVDYRALLEAKLTRLHEHLREKAGLKEGEDFTDAHRAALGIKPLPPEYGG